MDRITKNNMEKFLRTYQIQEKNESKQFELYASFCAISQLYNDRYDISSIITGGGNDYGIDSTAIIINGTLVNDEEEFNDIIGVCKKLVEIKFVFVQAKTSPKFECKEMTTFGKGVGYLFDEKRHKFNGFLQQKIKLINRIYKERIVNKPNIYMYYVTTGKWIDDDMCKETIMEIKEKFNSKNNFDNVEFIPVDANKLNKYYDESENAIERDLCFPERNRIVLPTINGIGQAYLGYVDINDFKELIMNENGELISKVFYNNIRDFQGENDVNKEIEKTIKNGNKNFILLNNGVTIICKNMIPKIADQIRLIDYQIVNGCQTSHAIYRCKDSISDDLQIPIKIIETNNDEIINSIIMATNSQTPINKTQLLGLSDFAKKLESYYDTFTGENKLYFERRSKQYNGSPEITNSKIITIKEQIKTLASMFYELPHFASRFYTKILKSRNKIFDERHLLEPYYISALALYKFELLIKEGRIEYDYRKYRYFAIALLKYRLIGNFKLDICLKSHREIFDRILNILLNDEDTFECYKEICDMIKEEVNDLKDTEKTKSDGVYKKLIKKMNKLKPFLKDWLLEENLLQKKQIKQKTN